MNTMNIDQTARSIAQQRHAASILKPITAQQVLDYSPGTSDEQAERLAAAHNETWAGRSWEIRDGQVVYS